MIEKVLNLKRHCIESEIKRIYEKLILSFFRTKEFKEKTDIEKQIAFFERLLKDLDFGYLRSSYPPLSGGYDGPVKLVYDGRHAFLMFEEKKILLPFNPS